MGADLVINAIAVRDGVELDWESGIAEAMNYQFSEEQKKDFVGMWLGDNYEPDEAPLTTGDIHSELLREHIIKGVDKLKESIAEGYARDVAWLKFGEFSIWVCGGSTWGDSPGPTWSALQDLWEVPEVLWTIGFEWPPYSPGEQEDLPLETA